MSNTSGCFPHHVSRNVCRAGAARLLMRAPVLCAFLAASGCIAQPQMAIVPPPGSCVPAAAPVSAWIAPVAHRDREALDRACAQIGPPRIALVPAVPHDAGGAITVVSWNLHAGAADLPRFLDDIAAPNRPGGTVLLLQETTAAARAALARAGFALAYAPEHAWPADEGGERGNAVAATLPLADVAIIELPVERQRRVAIAARIDLDGAGPRPPVAFVSTHLEVGWLAPRGGSEEARERQARALVDAVALGGMASLPIVIGADANASYGDTEPAIALLRREFPDARQRRRPTWRGPYGLRRQLDYIFARVGRPLQVSVMRERYGSDHYPLVVRW
jgi:endonuclease/exonuclease/phosphatase family metal-dependent hydrolase